MLWFYTRDRDSLRLETRCDNQTLEYVGIVTHPAWHEDARRFATAEVFRLAGLVGHASHGRAPGAGWSAYIRGRRVRHNAAAVGLPDRLSAALIAQLSMSVTRGSRFR
jgi:hypothetical protein